MAMTKTFENEAHKRIGERGTELKVENVTAPLADSPVPLYGERAVSSFVLLCLSWEMAAVCKTMQPLREDEQRRVGGLLAMLADGEHGTRWQNEMSVP